MSQNLTSNFRPLQFNFFISPEGNSAAVARLLGRLRLARAPVVWAAPPHLSPTPPTPHPSAGAFTFRDIAVVARYGVDYALVFTLVPVPGLPVADARSRRIVARPCGPRQFWVKGRLQCDACPAGAACNGSDALVTRPNFWRSGASLDFFACADVVGEAGPPCLGGVREGACSTGFTGPLCRVCTPGRAGDGCAPCPEPAMSALYVMGAAAAYMGLIGFTILKVRPPPPALRDADL